VAHFHIFIVFWDLLWIYRQDAGSPGICGECGCGYGAGRESGGEPAYVKGLRTVGQGELAQCVNVAVRGRSLGSAVPPAET